MDKLSNFDAILIRLQKDGPTALDELRKYAEHHQKSEHAWAHLTWNLNGNGFIEEAYQAANHLLTLLPDSADAHRLHARICFQKGLIDQTVKSFENAVNLAIEPCDYLIETVEALLHAGRSFAALKVYFRLRKSCSAEHPIPGNLFKKIIAGIITTVFAYILFIPSIRNLLARWLFKKFTLHNRWGWAFILARSIAAIDNHNGTWAANAADALYRKRDFFFPEYDKEIIWRNIALKNGGQNASVQLARAHLHAGHAKTALDILSKETSLPVEGESLLAHALAATGRNQEAALFYRKLGNNNAIHFTNAGIVQLHDQQYDKALIDFEDALRIDPAQPMAAFFHQVIKEGAAQGMPDANTLDEILQKNAEDIQFSQNIREKRTDWKFHTDQLLSTSRYRIIPCPHCQSEGFEPVYFDSASQWVRVKCAACGFHYANPQPMPETIPGLYSNDAAQASSLQRFFRQTLDQALAQPKDELAAMLERNEKWWEPEYSLADFENQCGSNRRMLDVGCSVGTTMINYQCREWSVSGIDLDENAISIAKSVGLDVYLTTLEAADYENESFDLITMMDVIEHVANYKPVLRKLYGLLKPGGVLKLKTPCAESIIHYQYGQQWLSNDTHLLYFTRRSLLEGLSDAGFEIIGTRSYLEANKLQHTFKCWRDFSITPILDSVVMRLDIGDTILVISRKNK